MSENMPVYVRVDEYKDVLDTVADLQKKLADAKALLAQIEDIKHEEESEIESWKIGLDDVDEKIASLQAILSKQ